MTYPNTNLIIQYQPNPKYKSIYPITQPTQLFISFSSLFIVPR